jgi:hypothetical protein
MKVNVTGGWIEIREPKEVPERLRRPIVELTMAGVPLQPHMEAMQNDLTAVDPDVLTQFMQYSAKFNDKAILALVKEWSFPDPVSEESIMDLPAGVFDEIQEAIAPFISELLPNFGVDPDPKATTDN